MTGPLHPEFRPGEVWLVGAGPGDPGLLTLRAVHALSTADVIVHDALIDARVLAMARPGAVLEPMGKRGGRPSPRQAEITARLLERARQGLRVLRLKGGDPYVFGRGGEEAVALLAAGVPVRVVPGVTAGLGGLAAYGAYQWFEWGSPLRFSTEQGNYHEPGTASALKQQFFAAQYALGEGQLSATECRDGGFDGEQVVQARRFEVFGGNRAHGEGHALLHQLILVVAESAQELGAPAFYEAQVVGVIDDSGGIGVLVIDPDRQYFSV